MSNIQGVQMIGTQRSGSNMLRLILNQSPEVVSPHPAHVLVNFVPLLHLYEPMDAHMYTRLVKDVVAYIEANPVLWPVEFDASVLISKSQEYSLYELNKVIYEYVACANDAHLWVCKSMANVYYTDQMQRNQPDLKYIYLYRDGRDVALSFQKAVVGEKHIYHIARQWHEDQQASIALRQKLSGQCLFCLNYEELLADCESTVRRLCTFLQIAYDPSMLNFYTSDESKRTAAGGEMWSNVTKPLMRDNSRKFLQEMSMQDIEIFERVAGQSLIDLGYDLIFPDSVGRGFTQEEIQEFEAVNARKKKEIVKQINEEDIKKRQKQLDILSHIRTYSADTVVIS